MKMRSPATKVTLEDAKKIVNILYPSLAQKSRQALPLIRSKLQTKGGLDELKKNFPKDLKPLADSLGLLNKKPLSQAVQMLPKNSVQTLSNVLQFRTRNQLLHRSDFTKLAPLEQSTFDWSGMKESDRSLNVVQSRYPDTLLPRGGYYLLFDNAEHAAAYLVDTLGKELNGVNVYLEMVEPKEHLKFISQKLLSESALLTDDNILKLEQQNPRRKSVLVKGIPTFIKKSTLKQMLWDFDLDFQTDPIVNLKTDNIAKIGLWLLTFENHLESLRFVRRFNGKHFNNEIHLPKIFASVLS